MAGKDLSKIPTFEEKSDLVNVVVETSKGMRTKLKYDEKAGIFRAEKTLPLGLAFPFDFGFLPATLGGDGDPLDVLVLSEAGLPYGCVVLGQLVGVLECEQTEKGETRRNDRLIAVPIDAKSRQPMQPSIELDERLNKAIGDFFAKYNELQGKKFRLLGMHGPDQAMEIVRRGMELAKRNGKRKKR